MGLNFDCDRPAKNDFTASTIAFCKTLNSFSAAVFYETDKYQNLVPYGDPRAKIEAHYDIWMDYITSAWTQRYVFELKERGHNSNSFSTAFINEEKWPAFIPLRESGIIPMWVELYEDGLIRIWNLKDVDFTSLPLTQKWIKKINIDPNSKKQLQWRREISMQSGMTISRINTKEGDEQRNSKQ